MKVSVITITHNRAHLIGDTIKSVLAQTWTDLEHIIVDDGSTDDTESVVASFDDRRIKYVRLEKQSQPAFLRNECIRRSTGALICILDSDDLWAPDKLQRLIAAVNEFPQTGFIIHDLAFVSGGEIIETGFFPYKHGIIENIYHDLLNNKILPYPVFAITKSGLDKIGMFDQNMYDGEQDLYFRAATQLQCVYLPHVLTFMRKHDGNISASNDMRNYDEYLLGLTKLYRNGYLPAKEYQLQMSHIYRKMGYLYRHAKQYRRALFAYRQSLGYHIKSYGHG